MRRPGKIEHFRPAQQAALIAAINAVCAEGRWMHTPRFVPTSAWVRALRHGSGGTSLLLVATDGDTVIGWCRVFPVDGGQGGEVGIGILAPYRNQGVGTSLLQEAIAWARERGFSYLRLSTRRDNLRAIHVFERCGFRAVDCYDEWMTMCLFLHSHMPGEDA